MEFKEELTKIFEELENEVDIINSNPDIPEEEYINQLNKIYKKQKECLEYIDELISEGSELEREYNEKCISSAKKDFNDTNKDNEEKSKEERSEKGNINNNNKRNLNKKKGLLLIGLFIVVSIAGIKIYQSFRNKHTDTVQETINLADPNTISITDIKTEDEDKAVDIKDNLLVEKTEKRQDKELVAVENKFDNISKRKITDVKEEIIYDDTLQRDRNEIDKALEDIEGERPQKRDYKKFVVNSMTFFKKEEKRNGNSSGDRGENKFEELYRRAYSLKKEVPNEVTTKIENRLLNSFDYSILQGSIIPAILITEINTDIPGDIIAQVRENIYDTKTGKYLLVPKGSKLYGRYNAAIVNGQNRVMIAFDKLILPNGTYVNLTAMPGADNLGISGLNDKTDNHTFSLLGNAVLASVLNFGNTMAKGISFAVGGKIVGLNGKETKEKENTSPFEKATGKILDRAIDRKPTLTVRKGFVFNVIVNGEIVMQPYKY